MFDLPTGNMALLCSAELDELTTRVDDWVAFLRRNVSVLSAQNVMALLRQAESTEPESEMRRSVTNVSETRNIWSETIKLHFV